MKGTFFRVLGFVVLIDVFYMYVGQTVTQAEHYPPEQLEITPETDEAELVAMGEVLVRNKGGCLICHKIAETGNDRGPDLRGVGGRAAARVPGLRAEEYILQSLREPQAFVVEGFPPIMPVADLPPADLTATELKAVAAFLESLGGEVTVRVTAEDVTAAITKASTRGALSPEQAFFNQKGCTACHDIRGESRRIGPPLTTVVQRLSPEEIRRSILDPDAVVAEGFAPGLMPKTFAKDLTEEDLETLVGHLVSLNKAASATVLVRMAANPIVQLVSLIFLFNAGAWCAVEWLEVR